MHSLWSNPLYVFASAVDCARSECAKTPDCQTGTEQPPRLALRLSKHLLGHARAISLCASER